MGCAWAAMLAMPFTILTNALSGGNIGTYLGLFNCTITVPQIVAALCGRHDTALLPGCFERCAADRGYASRFRHIACSRCNKRVDYKGDFWLAADSRPKIILRTNL